MVWWIYISFCIHQIFQPIYEFSAANTNSVVIDMAKHRQSPRSWFLWSSPGLVPYQLHEEPSRLYFAFTRQLIAVWIRVGYHNSKNGISNSPYMIHHNTYADSCCMHGELGASHHQNLTDYTQLGFVKHGILSVLHHYSLLRTVQ